MLEPKCVVEIETVKSDLIQTRDALKELKYQHSRLNTKLIGNRICECTDIESNNDDVIGIIELSTEIRERTRELLKLFINEIDKI